MTHRLTLFAWAWVALVLTGALVFGADAQEATGLQPVPPLTARVIDQTDTLGAPELAALEDKLAALERDKGSQMVVLLVPTTAPEDIAAYANRVGNAWKIGRRDVGDGLIVLVAKNDRHMRIEVAKALEGAVPDIAAKHVIDEVMMPAFRRGDFAGGLDAAVDQLAARIRGEELPAVAAPPDSLDLTLAGGHFELILMALFAVPAVAMMLRSVLGRKLGALLTGLGVGGLAFWIGLGLVLATLIGLGAFVYSLVSNFTSASPGRMGGGRSGWGGGGGGGFSSGGGANFGGGGASGSW